MKLLKVMIIGCLLLSGCSRIQVPNNEDTNNQTPEVSEPSTNIDEKNDNVDETDKTNEVVSKVDINALLKANGYESYNGMLVRLVNLEDGDFYYTFLADQNEFIVVNAHTNDNYPVSIVTSTGSYVDTLLDAELIRLGISRSDFKDVNHEYIGYTSVNLSDKLINIDSKNVYQILMANNYVANNGFYVKNFDYGKLAFNLKGRNITLHLNGTDAYYQYSPDYNHHVYTYKNGECTYNKYANISSNCFSSDKEVIQYNYDQYIIPELEKLGLHLYDLDLYYDMMIANGTWNTYQYYKYDTYPNLSESIINVDEDIAMYLYKEFLARNAEMRSTSFSVNYRGKVATFYFEDKTFTYGDSNLIYDWRNEIVTYDKCRYDFGTSSAENCSDAEKVLAKELKYTMQSILDSYGLIKKELHIYANSRRIFDKTLGGAIDAE